MRRKISLYIAGERADLSDQGLVLFNWTQSDAASPTAVVAPYSQQVTLPGTPANDRIFGAFWRADRTATSLGGWTGSDFDPLRKMPFSILADTGEVLESGYLRLDAVTRKRCRVEYKVTLFGGVGSFFRALSVNGDGTPMTLADLDYGGGSAEFDFTIDAGTVRQAWDDLWDETPGPWTALNFAPAYEGIPEGDFDAAKGVAAPTPIGLPDTQPGGYGVKNGLCLVNLPQKYDEWAVKDLRSYLQRPVLRFSAILDAIARKAVENGYTFDWSGIPGAGSLADPQTLWLTLPLLTSIAPIEVTGASIDRDPAFIPSDPVLAEWAVTSGTIPAGTQVTASVAVKLALTHTPVSPLPTLTYTRPYITYDEIYRSVIFLRLVGYSSGVEVARSKVLAVNCQPGFKPLDVYNVARGEDSGLAEEDFYDGSPQPALTTDGVDQLFLDTSLALSVQGANIDEVHMEMESGWVRILRDRHSGEMRLLQGLPSLDFLPVVFDGSETPVRVSDASVSAGDTADSVAFAMPSTIRSGARLDKRLLLGSSKTPAEYLLSFAKTFGLYFVVDNVSKAVSLVTRGGFFNGATVDLTRRVERSTLEVRPLAVDSMFYIFQAQTAGKFAAEYEKTYGRTYGARRVNTGYEFNDAEKDIISGSVLRGAVTALEASGYWNYIVGVGGVLIPSPFLDAGVSYTLWDADGKSLDTPVPTPAASSVTVNYYNEEFTGSEGYDANFARKLQLHAADGKAVAGEDVLVYLEGWQTYEYFKVSDDTPAMLGLTGGKACWDLSPGTAAGQRLPVFQRYTYSAGGWNVDNALDFGTPAALAIPCIAYGEDKGIYARCWKAYLADLYSRNTRVVRCKVHFGGIPVGAGLLRNFYYFDDSLWVLNKIENYSLTSYAPVECEFIKVHDPAAYTAGQNF